MYGKESLASILLCVNVCSLYGGKEYQYVFMLTRKALMLASMVWVLWSTCTVNLRSSVKNIARPTAGT